jgi:hypothetical protein
MILRGAEEEVPEPLDLADIRRRYDRLIDLTRELDAQDRSAGSNQSHHRSQIVEPGAPRAE